MVDIDLHIHSYYSDDGEFSPEKLADFCILSNVKTFSVTDHNNTKAIPFLLDYCKDKDINFVPGIEIDCIHEGRQLHLLGYGIDHTDPAYEQLWADCLYKQIEASEKRAELVRRLGIEFLDSSAESLSVTGIITGEIIAEAAFEYDEEKTKPLLQPYYEGGARSDNPFVNFYWDFCSQGKPAYVPVEFISLDEAISIISRSGGRSVLAHPGNNVGEDGRFLDSIISCGVDGIEAFSTYHTQAQSDYYCNYAQRNDLLITCGSDFHGKTKPKIKIGNIDCRGHEYSLNKMPDLLKP